MKAVVIGATGHIGNAIVRELLSRGIEVTATSRRSNPATNLADLPVHFASGDSRTPGQFDSWIAGQDLVVDAAAPYPLSVLCSDEFVSMAVRRTETLLSAVNKHGASLVAIGSFATTASTRRGLDALSYEMLRRSHPYFAVKEAIEARHIDAARKGSKVILLNPTMCIGPWDLRSPELCIIPRLLRGEVPAMTNQTLNLIDVRDVANAAVTAFETDRCGEPIPLVGHNIPVDMLFRWICEVGGVPPPRSYISSSIVTAASYWSELTYSLLGREAPIPSVFLMLASTFDIMDTVPGRSNLGTRTRPLYESILDAIDWYRQIGYC